MQRANREAKQEKEYRGKTQAEVLQHAAEDLGIPVAKLRYEVVEDSTRTILGIIPTGEVKIRVELPLEEQEAEEPAEREPAAEEAPEAAEAEVSESAEEADLERNPPELREEASRVISTLLDRMDILAAVEVADPGGEIEEEGEVSPLILNVVGDDLGILIGRRGSTLRDFQFIVRLILNRRLGVWPNLVVDVEGYKARREETLRALAERMADQVKRTGRRVVLEPMPANERRIIHITLRDDREVYTESTGKDDKRKVQIFPR